ncbi:hypothetical protein PLIIFM63780_001813 [Purpureocillium lilacinum]|nr:hypothetical protein PLIIFM63780_001813 [Purpureocillium lilacinum]
MKTAALASAVFIAAAAAQPRGHGHQHKHAARNVVTQVEWVTQTEYVTEYIDATTTVVVGPGHQAEPTTTSVKPNFFEPPSSSAPAPGPSSSSAAAPPPPPPAPTTPTTTSVYTPPPPPPSTPKAEPTTAPVVAAPPPQVQPSSSPSPEPAPSPSPTPSNGGGNGGGESRTGDITYFAIGLGACGTDLSNQGDSVSVVALSAKLMGSQSNGNPYCGRTISIKASNGKTTTAKVQDKCPECTADSIDVSNKVFKDLFGGFELGRTTVTWSFLD